MSALKLPLVFTDKDGPFSAAFPGRYMADGTGRVVLAVRSFQDKFDEASERARVIRDAINSGPELVALRKNFKDYICKNSCSHSTFMDANERRIACKKCKKPGGEMHTALKGCK